MFIEQYKTLFDKADYEANKTGGTHADEPITTDQFNVTNKICHVISSSAKQGFFGIRFAGLTTGDIIEFECEFRSISGILPKVAVDEMSGTSNANKIIFSAKKTGEWETVTGRYVVQNTTYTTGDHRISFGLFTVDVGEFYMRNAKVKCFRNNAENIPSTESGTANGGNYTKFTDGTMICTMTTTIDCTANTDASKTIVYPVAFISEPQKFVNIEGVSGSEDYTIKNIAFRKGSLAAGRLAINASVTQTYTVNLMAVGRWK